MFPGAPTNTYCAMGVGTQIIYVDPDNDLVVVARWIEKDKVSEFIKLILAAVSS
jgi:CubicO group peptidase (beta-lactamase class C family)